MMTNPPRGRRAAAQPARTRPRSAGSSWPASKRASRPQQAPQVLPPDHEAAPGAAARTSRGAGGQLL